jgi:hypothetical protein
MRLLFRSRSAYAHQVDRRYYEKDRRYHATTRRLLVAVGRLSVQGGAARNATRDAIRDWIGNLQPGRVVRGDPQAVTDFWQHHPQAWRTYPNLEDINNALESAEWRRLIRTAALISRRLQKCLVGLSIVANVDWRQADPATAALDEYDLLTSAFGTMFFGDLHQYAPHRRSRCPHGDHVLAHARRKTRGWRCP